MIVFLDKNTVGFDHIKRIGPNLFPVRNEHTDVCLGLLDGSIEDLVLCSASDEYGDADIVSMMDAIDYLIDADLPNDTVIATTLTFLRNQWTWAIESRLERLASKYKIYSAAGNYAAASIENIIPAAIRGITVVGALNKAGVPATLNPDDPNGRIDLFYPGTNITISHGNKSGTSMSLCLCLIDKFGKSS